MSCASMRVQTVVQGAGIVTALAFSPDSRSSPFRWLLRIHLTCESNRALVSASMGRTARVTLIKDTKKDGTNFSLLSFLQSQDTNYLVY